MPDFAQVLREETKSEGPLADSGKSGLIVADRTGKVIHLSKEGRHLLTLATHPTVTPDTDLSRLGMLPAPLVRICQDLFRIFSDDPSESAPVHHHRNVWGGFRFQAQWLNGNDPASGFIGIVVTHEEPLPLALMRRVEALPLSHRRAQVCFLLARGASQEEIAAQLGISKHTAIAHGRWIYEELGVHNRAELVNRLLAA